MVQGMRLLHFLSVARRSISPTTDPLLPIEAHGYYRACGQAAPASRCEPTFWSSETPALLVPKQRPCDVTGRLRSESGTAFEMSIPPITNHHERPF